MVLVHWCETSMHICIHRLIHISTLCIHPWVLHDILRTFLCMTQNADQQSSSVFDSPDPSVYFFICIVQIKRKASQSPALWTRKQALTCLRLSMTPFQREVYFQKPTSILSWRRKKKNKSKAIGKLHLWCMRLSVKFSSTECGQCYKSNYQGHCLMIKLACKLLRL